MTSFSDVIHLPRLGFTVTALCVTSSLWLLWTFYKQRAKMRNLPGPPHSWFWGHLKVVAELQNQYPTDIHGQWYPLLAQREYDLPSVFYLDFWPVNYQFCIVSDPEISQQVQLRTKHPAFWTYVNDMLGKYNLTALEGHAWKSWRGVFNPGFAASNLMTLIPSLVEETQIFCGILEEHAYKGNIFRMERAATNLTVDIIGRVVLDLRFEQQTSKDNEYLKHLLGMIDRYPFGPAYGQGYSPIYRVKIWWHKRQMYKYLARVLRARLSASRQAVTSKPGLHKKTVMDLALESYKSQNKATEAFSKLDPDFERHAIEAINSFIFAGHDTTSSVIAYAYHMLSKHPEVLANVMREHDDIFGKDLSEVPKLLQEQPYLINKLDYTLAVIKEVMRLFPPASTLRNGGPDFTLYDTKSGKHFPTFSDTSIWVNSLVHHRNAANFVLPDTFIPERFLLPSSKYYSPTAAPNVQSIREGAFRPFEHGPRACIGSSFALIEARVVLLMTVRRFEFKAAYGDLDKVVEDGTKWGDPAVGQGVKVLGEEAYQIQKATAKPSQGMPGRVSIRKRV